MHTVQKGLRPHSEREIRMMQQRQYSKDLCVPSVVLCTVMCYLRCCTNSCIHSCYCMLYSFPHFFLFISIHQSSPLLFSCQPDLWATMEGTPDGNQRLQEGSGQAGDLGYAKSAPLSSQGQGGDDAVSGPVLRRRRG